MRITRAALSLMLLITLSSCVSAISSQDVAISGGKIATYVFGKVAGDGQEAVFRDAFIDGQPVLTHFGSGQSLTASALQGVGAAAMIGGGMAGAAALRRPDKYINNETQNLNNEGSKQQQQQLQAQEQEGKLTNANSSSSNSAAASSSHSSSHSKAINQTKVKTITTVQPGVVEECKGNCSDNNHDNNH